MRDPFHKSKSAEQFSAWLDGNLSHDEMLSFSEAVSEDPELQQIAELCEMTDDDIAAFEASGAKLPIELNNDYFALPDLDRPYAHCQVSAMDMCKTACCVAPPKMEKEERLKEKFKKLLGLTEEDGEDDV